MAKKHPQGCMCTVCKSKRPRSGDPVIVGKRPGTISRVTGAYVLVSFHDGKNPRRKLYPLTQFTSRTNPPDLAEAKAEYEAKHWGEPARKGVRVSVPTPKGALVEMGRLKAVVYDTTKKGDGPSTYVHEFEGTKPKLAFDTRKGKKRLFIVGGSYDVKDRGIVG